MTDDPVLMVFHFQAPSTAKRSKRSSGRATDVNPSDLEFDPKEFRDYVARTLWVTCYADWAEQYGHLLDKPIASMGADWMDVSPDTPAVAFEFADKLIGRLEKEVAPLPVIVERAKATWLGRRPDSKFTDELAYSLTMASLGQGVGWTDYNDEFEGCDGLWHFEFSYLDVPEDLLPVPEESDAD